jgi:hypothetical protein
MVVVGQNHLSFTSTVGSFLAHGNTMSAALSVGIVDAVTSHAANFSIGLESLDDLNSCLATRAGQNVVLCVARRSSVRPWHPTRPVIFLSVGRQVQVGTTGKEP